MGTREIVNDLAGLEKKITGFPDDNLWEPFIRLCVWRTSKESVNVISNNVELPFNEKAHIPPTASPASCFQQESSGAVGEAVGSDLNARRLLIPYLKIRWGLVNAKEMPFNNKGRFDIA